MRHKQTYFTTQLTQKSHKCIKIIKVKSDFKPSEHTQYLIENGWEKATEKMRQKDWKFYDGPLVRYEDIEEKEDSINIKVSHTITYKDIVGLRANPYESFKKITPEKQMSAISAINIIITSDNMIPLGLRASGDWDESFELSGGFMRTNESCLVKSSKNRLQDDMNITKHEIVDQKLHALIHHPTIAEVMAVFIVRVDLSISEIMNKNTRYRTIMPFLNNKKEWEQTKRECALAKKTEFHPPSRAILDTYILSNITSI